MWFLVFPNFFFLFGPICVYSFVCGFRFWPILFAVLDEFFFGFAVSSVPQCPPPLYNAANDPGNDPQTGPQMIPAVAARDPAGKRAGNLMQG